MISWNNLDSIMLLSSSIDNPLGLLNLPARVGQSKLFKRP
jgi:hypothetical protein